MSASTVLAVTVYANPSLCPSECTQLVSVLLLKVLKWDLARTLVSKVRSKEKEKLSCLIMHLLLPFFPNPPELAFLFQLAVIAPPTFGDNL